MQLHVNDVARTQVFCVAQSQVFFATGYREIAVASDGRAVSEARPVLRHKKRHQMELEEIIEIDKCSDFLSVSTVASQSRGPVT
jgi:hypothetical protein